MRQILELLAIPVIVSALANILTSNLRLRVRTRLPVVIGLGVAAFALVIYVNNHGGTQTDVRKEGVSTRLPEVPLEPGTLKPESKVDHFQTDSPRSSLPTGGLVDYINAPPRSRHSPLAWAVLIYGDHGRDYPVLRAVAQDALSRNDVSMPSLFRPSTPDSAYDDIFVANVSTLSGLKPFCDGIVVGRVERNTNPSDQFSGMFTCHMSADMKLISVASGLQREFVIEDNGAGFSAEDSESKAEKRLAEKLKIELAEFLFR